MTYSPRFDSLSSELILNAHDLITVKQLLLNGANINYQSDTGWCLLFELIALGLDNEIEILSHYEIDIHIKDNKGRNALFWAIYHGNNTLVNRLISLGCNPSEFIMPALPSLHYAIFKNEKEIVNSLINWGVNINICDSNYSNALAYAYLYEKEEMIELLISQGATCCETKPIL